MSTTDLNYCSISFPKTCEGQPKNCPVVWYLMLTIAIVTLVVVDDGDSDAVIVQDYVQVL